MMGRQQTHRCFHQTHRIGVSSVSVFVAVFVAVAVAVSIAVSLAVSVFVSVSVFVQEHLQPFLSSMFLCVLGIPPCSTTTTS
jgi:hypothetical protein